MVVCFGALFMPFSEMGGGTERKREGAKTEEGKLLFSLSLLRPQPLTHSFIPPDKQRNKQKRVGEEGFRTERGSRRSGLCAVPAGETDRREGRGAVTCKVKEA